MSLRQIMVLMIVISLFFVISSDSLITFAEEEPSASKKTKLKNPFMDYNIQEKKSKEKNENETASGENSNNNAETNDGNKQYQPQPLTFAEVKSRVNFRLVGVLSSNKENIAIFKNAGSSKFIRSNREINGFSITNINEDFISLKYKNFRIRMKIGGEIVEVE